MRMPGSSSSARKMKLEEIVKELLSGADPIDLGFKEIVAAHKLDDNVLDEMTAKLIEVARKVGAENNIVYWLALLDGLELGKMMTTPLILAHEDIQVMEKMLLTGGLIKRRLRQLQN